MFLATSCARIIFFVASTAFKILCGDGLGMGRSIGFGGAGFLEDSAVNINSTDTDYLSKRCKMFQDFSHKYLNLFTAFETSTDIYLLAKKSLH